MSATEQDAITAMDAVLLLTSTVCDHFRSEGDEKSFQDLCRIRSWFLTRVDASVKGDDLADDDYVRNLHRQVAVFLREYADHLDEASACV